jgi:hypothetical protein
LQKNINKDNLIQIFVELYKINKNKANGFYNYFLTKNSDIDNRELANMYKHHVNKLKSIKFAIKSNLYFSRYNDADDSNEGMVPNNSKCSFSEYSYINNNVENLKNIPTADNQIYIKLEQQINNMDIVFNISDSTEENKNLTNKSTIPVNSIQQNPPIVNSNKSTIPVNSIQQNPPIVNSNKSSLNNINFIKVVKPISFIQRIYNNLRKIIKRAVKYIFTREKSKIFPE